MSTAFEGAGGLFEFAQPETPWETGQYESIFETDPESALVTELLGARTDEELDQFLGKLARGVIRGATSFVKSPIGRALGGVLKNVAKTALPMVGGALGSMVLPGVGTALGSKLGSMAGNLLEDHEIAALGEEQAQQEAARRYIRFAGAAYRNAARTPRSVPPRVAIRAAALSAARTHAPGLLRPGGRGYGWRDRRRGFTSALDFPYDDTDWVEQPGDPYAVPIGATSGRWVRRGNRVTLIGL
jgi:uncharacterized protein (DUF697 family)